MHKSVQGIRDKALLRTILEEDVGGAGVPVWVEENGNVFGHYRVVRWAHS